MDALAEKDVLIFVSPDGNDANAGTAARPLRSFGEAVRRLHPLWLKKQRIVLAPGRYEIGKTSAADQKLFYIHLGQQVGGEGEPLVIQGAFTTVHSGVVQSSSDSTLTDPLLKSGPNQYFGAKLRFTSGALKGQAFLIHESIGILLKVVGTFGQKPDGANYVIERPAVTITYEQGITFEGGGATELFMTGIRWVPKSPAAGASNFFLLNGAIKLYAEACEWDMGGGLFQASQSSEVTFGGGVQQLVSGDLTLAGANGCYIHNGYSEFGIRATEAAVIFGQLVAKDIGISAQGGQIALEMVSQGCKIISDGSQGNSFVMLGPATISGAPADAVTVSNNAQLIMFQTAINKAKGHAVVVKERAYASLSGITGGENGDHGIRVAQGARAQADAASTVTGKNGDVLIGGATHPWSDVNAGISDAATFARIDRGE